MASEVAAPPRAATGRALPPRLADGVELLGEFEDSGLEEPPHLARRADGQVIQLTKLLHLVAEAADGRRDLAAVAELVSDGYGRRVSPDNVAFLVEKRLRPLGVLAAADGSSPRLKKADPLLALRHRTTLVPAPAVQRVARVFTPLHWAPVLVALLAALVALDVWIFFSHGIAGGLRGALYQPELLLGLFGAVIVATAFHEIGHAAACRYAGAKPGVLGAGVYLVWPAFYCDVTDAYRLNRAGRLRTDLGGVYFNGLFALAAGGAFLLTGFEPLVLVIVAQHMIILQQLLPILRFDGYLVMSDLTGVPDIIGRIKPILASLIPGREPDARVKELKPWVRVVVTAYVALLVPVLLLLLVVVVLHAPRLFATAYDSAGLQLDRVGAAVSEGAVASVALGALQVLALALPCAAIALSAGRIGSRAGRGLRGWASGSAPRSAIAVTGVAGLAALAAWTWWPNGDYEPIRPGEKGTLGQAVRSIGEVPSGRPSFTEAAEARVGAEPTVREREAAEREREAPASERPAPADDPAGETAPGSDRDAPDRPEPTATPTPTPAPSESATPAPAGADPAAPPPAAATPEPAATASPTPTPTATPSPTPAATATPTATAAP